MPLFLHFCFLSYNTLQNMVGSHHTILYMMSLGQADVYLWNELFSSIHITQIIVMRLGQANVHGTVGL
jgi:hypothetical protein